MVWKIDRRDVSFVPNCIHIMDMLILMILLEDRQIDVAARRVSQRKNRTVFVVPTLLPTLRLAEIPAAEVQICESKPRAPIDEHLGTIILGRQAEWMLGKVFCIHRHRLVSAAH